MAEKWLDRNQIYALCGCIPAHMLGEVFFKKS